MIVHQIGNFEPPYSTENEIKRALESLDITVLAYQENKPQVFNDLAYGLTDSNRILPDLILWTHTQYPNLDKESQWKLLLKAQRNGIPVIGYHLDRWWGLSREHLLSTEPFFHVDTLYTADGGPHDWAGREINHKWLPPAVDEEQCKRGTPRDEYRSEIAFIGSWQPGYHPEHKHRAELISWLRNTYGDRVRFWPKQGQPAIRGKDLQDLIASCDVIVGDSCFTDTDHYWSDRIPETLGRGGFLIHPYITGLTEHFPPGCMGTWEPFNWNELKREIDFFLKNPNERYLHSDKGMHIVLGQHTYKKRMQTVLDDLGLAT